MRNQPKPLNRDRAMRAYSLRDGLTTLQDEDRAVTVEYFKRDGSQSRSHGKVLFFNGADGMDTMSVTIADPLKGNRTINLDLVIHVKPL